MSLVDTLPHFGHNHKMSLVDTLPHFGHNHKVTSRHALPHFQRLPSWLFLIERSSLSLQFSFAWKIDMPRSRSHCDFCCWPRHLFIKRHIMFMLTCKKWWTIQTQHFCHHGDTICHPDSRYSVHNNQTVLNICMWLQQKCGHSDKSIFTFPTIDVCWSRWPGSGQALVTHSNVAGWRHYLINYFSYIFRFCLTKYCVKY